MFPRVRWAFGNLDFTRGNNKEFLERDGVGITKRDRVGIERKTEKRDKVDRMVPMVSCFLEILSKRGNNRKLAEIVVLRRRERAGWRENDEREERERQR